jgi:hypothetical protein
MESRSANDSPHLSATVAGTFTMAEDLVVTRMGYGAMQLAGQHTGCAVAEPFTLSSYSTNPLLARAEGTPVLANTVKS